LRARDTFPENKGFFRVGVVGSWSIPAGDALDQGIHGARPVHLIITMIKWIRTSRLSMKNSLFEGEVAERRCGRCGRRHLSLGEYYKSL